MAMEAEKAEQMRRLSAIATNMKVLREQGYSEESIRDMYERAMAGLEPSDYWTSLGVSEETLDFWRNSISKRYEYYKPGGEEERGELIPHEKLNPYIPKWEPEEVVPPTPPPPERHVGEDWPRYRSGTAPRYEPTSYIGLPRGRILEPILSAWRSKFHAGSNYPRAPQSNIPTPKPEQPAPGRPAKPKTPFENLWSWKKQKPLWW